MSVGKLRPKIGVGAVCSPLEVGADRASGASVRLAHALEASGCEVVAMGRIDGAGAAAEAGRRMAETHVEAIVLAAASWFEDFLLTDLIEEQRVPLLLWALPGMETGALCGAQQATALLKQLGAVPYGNVFGELDDAACFAEAGRFVAAAALAARLRRTRVGMAGRHVNGMTHTTPNEIALKRAVGPRVVWLDLPELIRSAAGRPEHEADALWKEFRRRAARCDVADADGRDSMRVYAALRAAVTSGGLHAVTVGCYPELMGRVCLAASLLADDGVPMACEGDVNGAVAQYMLHLLSGAPTHHADWLDPVDEHSVVFTHCGSGSLQLAAAPGEVRIASVRLMGQGACALFTARTGPVTLVNLTPAADGYALSVLEGEAEPTGMVFPGNPVWVRFVRPVRELLSRIHSEGLGHHWAIGYGHHAETLQWWSRMAGAGLRWATL